MADSVFYDRVRFLVSSTGTADFSGIAALPGFRTPSGAAPSGSAVPNGTVVSYTAESDDLSQWECGQGTYSDGVLARNVIRESSTGAKVAFTNPPKIWFDVLAADILPASTGCEFANNPATTTGLTYGVFGGQLNTVTGPVTVADDAFTLVDNTTTYVEVPNNGFFHTPTSNFTPGAFACQIVVTSGGQITSITDVRAFAAALALGGSTGVTLNAGNDITLSPNPIVSSGTVNIAEKGITAATYTNPTMAVNSRGIITSIANGSGGSGGTPSNGQVYNLLGNSAANTPVWLRGAINAGNPAFGNINTSPRSTIQAAVDFCYANGFLSLYIPCPGFGASYTLDGPVFFDPPANMRAGITLGNQLLGVTATPTVFTFGLEVICDINTTFVCNYQTAPAFWVGTQNNIRLKNFNGIGPRNFLGGNLRSLDPRSTFIAIAAGNGGATNTAVYSSNARDFYAFANTGQNGQSALAEDNSFYDCLGSGCNVGLDIKNSQAFGNRIVGGNWQCTLAVTRNAGQGIEVIDAECGIVNTFQNTFAVTPGALVPVSITLPGGTAFNTFSFATAAATPLLDGTFFYNSGVIILPSFGVVPVAQNATGWTIDPGWCYYHFGEEVTLDTGTDFNTELAAVTQVFASSRGTVFVGAVTVEGRVHVESGHCMAFYSGTVNGAGGSFYDLETGNWAPGSGSDLNSTIAIINRHFPCINASSGDFIMRNSNFPAQQTGSVPIVIQFFDGVNSEYLGRGIIEGCVGFKNTNMRYVGNASTPSGGGITRGPGYDNTLASNAHFATKAFGGWEWDFPPWSYGGSGSHGLNFLEFSQGNGQFYRASGTGKTRYEGVRPARSQAIRLTTSDITNLTALSGTIPSICGGFPVEISQIGTTASTGGPATSGTQDVHRMIDVGGAGFSYYAGGALGASLAITWSCKGQTQFIFITGGALNSYYLYPGLEIGLTTDAGNIWYIVTGVYLYESAPYITVYRESTSASVISGVKTTTYTGATMLQRDPVLSFPGQLRTARVTTQFDSTNQTLTNITGLSKNVFKGLKYRFRVFLEATSDVAGGIKASIGGTCTATAITYEALTFNAAVLEAQTRATALGTTVGAVTPVTVPMMEIAGYIEVATSGTLTAQAARNAASGTTSILPGSFMELAEVV